MFFDFTDVLGDLVCEIRGDINGQYSQVTRDSRNVEANSIFVAVKGVSFDGHDFIDQALLSGAKAIVAEKLPDGAQGVVVSDSAAADALLQRHFYGTPDRDLSLFGVTGTNGKTTSVYILEHILNLCDVPCGLLSTIEFRTGGDRGKSNCTTPDAATLYRSFAEMRGNFLKAAAFELSSHALCQKRAFGLNLRGAILTNITRDHLDYHGSAENYFLAKKICFTKLLDPESGTAVINVDDAGGERMARELAGFCRVITFGSVPEAEWKISDIQSNLEETTFKLQNYQNEYWVKTSLFGKHNIENLTGAILLAFDYGIAPEKVLAAVADPIRIPGRLERYIDSDGVVYFVDYAHTPDALDRVLGTLKKDVPGKLIAVFGAGGDRDRGKRSEMGRAAAKHADKLIITSDNPRSEEPLDIINDIVSGLPSYASYRIEPDRREAIRSAINDARKGDVVLISGKGHEDYQEIKGVSSHFSDAVELGRLLEELKRRTLIN